MARKRRSRSNDYAGMVPQWKVNLALSRIKAFGFPKDQWPDILQHLVIEMVDFEFDAASGAKESTALCAVLNNHLMKLVRTEERARARNERHKFEVPAVCDEPTALFMDVRSALPALTSRERAVCEGLGRGESVHRIAQDLGCAWRTVDRIVEAVRVKFRRLGLDGWVEE